MKILLVEDDYILAKSTVKLIELLGGHSVFMVDEPAEVFRKCRNNCCDLILMDVNLAGAQWQGQNVSGADVSRMLKTQPETAHIPIILLTAYAMLNERQMLLEVSQANDLCTKPITDYEAFLSLMSQYAPNN